MRGDMRSSFQHLENMRLKSSGFGTNTGDPFGLFFVSIMPGKTPLKVICGPRGEEWEHVSVSLPNRCPTWEEMAKVKSLFFEDEETVVQIHPPKTEYVNNHSYCLHLWGHKNIPLPPSRLVGVKELGTLF